MVVFAFGGVAARAVMVRRWWRVVRLLILMLISLLFF